MLVKSCNTMSAAIDLLGFPTRYALLEAADTSGSAEFSEMDIDQTDSTVLSPNGRDSSIHQGPGEFLIMRAKQIGQFTAADPTGFLKVMDQMVSSMSATTSTPLRFFTDPGGQHPSGQSLRASDLQLKSKIRSRQVAFAAAWDDTFVFALKIMGIAVEEVTVVWEPLEPTDDRDEVSGVPGYIWKLRMGVSRRQVLRDSGYSDDEIEEMHLPDEDSEATPAELWPMAARTDVAAEVAASEEGPITEAEIAADPPPTMAPTPPKPGNTPPTPPPKAPGGDKPMPMPKRPGK